LRLVRADDSALDAHQPHRGLHGGTDKAKSESGLHRPERRRHEVHEALSTPRSVVCGVQVVFDRVLLVERVGGRREQASSAGGAETI
jgi:hypothetical protein